MLGLHLHRCNLSASLFALLFMPRGQVTSFLAAFFTFVDCAFFFSLFPLSFLVRVPLLLNFPFGTFSLDGTLIRIMTLDLPERWTLSGEPCPRDGAEPRGTHLSPLCPPAPRADLLPLAAPPTSKGKGSLGGKGLGHNRCQARTAAPRAPPHPLSPRPPASHPLIPEPSEEHPSR